LKQAALVLALVGAGCVCLPILGGPAPRDDDHQEESLDGLVDLRGIVHCHSKLSHDSSGEFEDIAGAAAETSCSFVAFTDHLRHREVVKDEPSGRIGGVLLIPGAELNMNGGSLLAIGVAAGIDRNLSDVELIAQVRALGGVAAIGHPEEWHLENVVDVDGCELLNVHAAALAENKLTLLLRVFFYPPRPFFSSIIERQDRAAAVYDAVSLDRPVAAIGACDAHEAIHPLGPLAGAIDSYRRLFRTATTHVLVPAGVAGTALARPLTKDDVLSALRRGRSYAASELTQDATGFRFVARDPGGSVLATLGGTAALVSGLALDVALPVAGRIALLRNGAEVKVAAEARSLHFVPRVPGTYRVEASYDGRPWIWSSGLRLEVR
jgi:hypothetical protein